QVPVRSLWAKFTGWADDPSNQLASKSSTDSVEDSSKWAKLLDGWEVSGIIVHQSGTPFTIINGGSPDGTSVLDNAGVVNNIGVGSFPDLVGDPNGPIPAGGKNGKSFGPLLGNPNAFVAPTGLTFGDVGRNSFNNPARTNFDTAILKNFHINESRVLE